MRSERLWVPLFGVMELSRPSGASPGEELGQVEVGRAPCLGEGERANCQLAWPGLLTPPAARGCCPPPCPSLQGLPPWLPKCIPWFRAQVGSGWSFWAEPAASPGPQVALRPSCRSPTCVPRPPGSPEPSGTQWGGQESRDMNYFQMSSIIPTNDQLDFSRETDDP